AREQRASVARRLYDINFSKTAFQSAWDTVLSAVMPELQLQNHSVPEQSVSERDEARLLNPPDHSAQRATCDAFVPDGDRHMPETRTGHTPRLSVAVCSYNRYDVLPDAIDSLLKQDCEPGFLDIMVI